MPNDPALAAMSVLKFATRGLTGAQPDGPVRVFLLVHIGAARRLA